MMNNQRSFKNAKYLIKMFNNAADAENLMQAERLV